MLRPLTAALILLVALTAIGLGTARGTVRMDERIVLCTGQGLVVASRPGPDGPAKAHVCPDMALLVLAGMGPPDDAVPLASSAPRLHLPPQHAAAALRHVRFPCARSPPARPSRTFA